MDVNLILKQLIEKNKTQCDFMAVRWVDETSSNYQYRNGKPLPNSQNFNAGAMIEVHYQGHVAYAGTCQTSQLGLQTAFENAIRLAKSHKKNAITLFDSAKIRPTHVGKYISYTTSPSQVTKIDQLSLSSIHSFLKKSNEKLQNGNSEIINAHSYIFDIQYNQIYMSSFGAEIDQKTQKLGIGLSATAQRGSDVQTRTFHGGIADCLQKPLNFLDEEFYFNECEKASNQAIDLLDAEECPSGTMDLVLMPDQMMLQIHESIGHPLELDRILGDERNYAGSSFVKMSDIGQLKYGSNLMNVSFDPTVETELATYGYDDNGHKATKEYLIQNGKLLRSLGGLESQFRSQLAGVANARSASWNRAPIDRMANINLEPGNSSFDEIISSVHHGVIMHANKSWSIDDFRNKFQFGCEFAQLIENGRITKTLKNPNYRGQTVPFWHNLKMVGNNSTLETYGTFFCGKGEPSQAISVGHRSPVCLFTSVEIFGGHS